MVVAAVAQRLGAERGLGVVERDHGAAVARAPARAHGHLEAR